MCSVQAIPVFVCCDIIWKFFRHFFPPHLQHRRSIRLDMKKRTAAGHGKPERMGSNTCQAVFKLITLYTNHPTLFRLSCLFFTRNKFYRLAPYFSEEKPFSDFCILPLVQVSMVQKQGLLDTWEEVD
jgi:hypothetical protein